MIEQFDNLVTITLALYRAGVFLVVVYEGIKGIIYNALSL